MFLHELPSAEPGDYKHASEKGSYLAALTLYQAIYGGSVSGLDAYDAPGVSRFEEDFLQAVVDNAPLPAIPEPAVALLAVALPLVCVRTRP